MFVLKSTYNRLEWNYEIEKETTFNLRKKNEILNERINNYKNSKFYTDMGRYNYSDTVFYLQQKVEKLEDEIKEKEIELEILHSKNIRLEAEKKDLIRKSKKNKKG